MKDSILFAICPSFTILEPVYNRILIQDFSSWMMSNFAGLLCIHTTNKHFTLPRNNWQIWTRLLQTSWTQSVHPVQPAMRETKTQVGLLLLDSRFSGHLSFPVSIFFFLHFAFYWTYTHCWRTSVVPRVFSKMPLFNSFRHLSTEKKG